jgi:hypothetical protein
VSAVPSNPSSLILQKRPAPLIDRTLTQFERDIGGRQALVELLAHAPKDDETDYILQLVADPDGDKRSLAELCIDGGIKPAKLISLLRGGELARGQMRALRKVIARLPEVTEDMMKRALPRSGKCPDCKGRKSDCPTCDGSGRVEIEPPLARQKLALEVSGLLVKAPSIQIQQNQMQAIQQQGIRDFQVGAARALYPQPQDVVDAEVEE